MQFHWLCQTQGSGVQCPSVGVVKIINCIHTCAFIEGTRTTCKLRCAFNMNPNIWNPKITSYEGKQKNYGITSQPSQHTPPTVCKKTDTKQHCTTDHQQRNCVHTQQYSTMMATVDVGAGDHIPHNNVRQMSMARFNTPRTAQHRFHLSRSALTF